MARGVFQGETLETLGNRRSNSDVSACIPTSYVRPPALAKNFQAENCESWWRRTESNRGPN
jgi:hypothetical protein